MESTAGFPGNLCRLDAAGVSLRLLVDTPLQLKIAVSAQPSEISSAVESCIRTFGKRIAGKLFGGQLWMIEIPTAHGGTTNADFARLIDLPIGTLPAMS